MRKKLRVLTNLPRIYVEPIPSNLSGIFEFYYVSSIRQTDTLVEFDASSINVIWIGIGEIIDFETLEKFSNLEILATSTTGITHIDEKIFNRKRIKLISLKDEHDFLKSISATSELAWGLFIAARRKYLIADRKSHFSSDYRTSYFSNQIQGSSIGIIGFGRIGKHIAKYALAFGAKVSYSDLKETVDFDSVEKKSLHQICESSDAIFICASTNFAGSKPIFGDNEINFLKEDVVLINVSRGSLVDEKAVLRALKQKRIAGYATDVLQIEEISTTSPISFEDIELSIREGLNLIVTPHLGGACSDALRLVNQRIMGKLISEMEKDRSSSN